MKRFVLKTLFFLLQMLIVCGCIKFFVPYHWGNVWYSTKVQHLENNIEQQAYNTFFFGSSRTYRQISPLIFDSVVNAVRPDLRSFNLGAPATFCPQTYYLYEQFLRSPESRNAQVVFMELMPVMNIEKDLLHQERSNYWENAKELSFIARAMFAEPTASYPKKLGVTGTHAIAYIENLFNLGQFNGFLMKENYYNSIYNGTNQRGFFSLQQDTLLNNDKEMLAHLRGRAHSLSEKHLKQRADEALQLSKQPPLPAANSVHQQRINDLIQQSQKRGIRLFFFLAPRANNLQSAALFQRIPPAHKIDLSNPAEFPAFYQISHSFDVGHLNDLGAREMTIALAQRFLQLSEQK